MHLMARNSYQRQESSGPPVPGWTFVPLDLPPLDTEVEQSSSDIRIGGGRRTCCSLGRSQHTLEKSRNHGKDSEGLKIPGSPDPSQQARAANPRNTAQKPADHTNCIQGPSQPFLPLPPHCTGQGQGADVWVWEWQPEMKPKELELADMDKSLVQLQGIHKLENVELWCASHKLLNNDGIMTSRQLVYVLMSYDVPKSTKRSHIGKDVESPLRKILRFKKELFRGPCENIASDLSFIVILQGDNTFHM
ncbi:hypothetical protein Y1Q_0017484 [Alligator mississippiensis]|uniref:Uncharacterized protein n=1 Tax=Alligator mississippiensis TaxID=8496 RepID=A0A151P245_ALLMI|nr:hypothetical protein Y1Q_0017484 [Alligator mississippiensis]